MGGVGQLGEGVQTGSVYRQPGTEVDNSVTSGGSQVSGRGHKGELVRGARGAREKKGMRQVYM